MSRLTRVRRCGLLALAYVVAGELAMSLNVLDGQLPFVWPPAGIALAAVLLWGIEVWPGIAIGAFAVVMLHHSVVDAAIALAVVDVFEILLAWWLLVHVFRLHRSLDRVRDVVALAGVATVVSVLAAVLGLGTLALLGRISLDQIGLMLDEWSWSHLSAQLLLAPLALTWLTKAPTFSPRRAPSLGELVALGACVAVADVVLLTGIMRDVVPPGAAPFYLLPLLLWAGLRFGPRGAATASFAVGAMAIASAITEHSPFAALPELEAFLSISAVATLTLSATALERHRAIHRAAAVQYVSLDPIISVDTRGRIVEFNPAAEQLFGRRAAQVLGKDAAILIPERRQAAYRRALRNGDKHELTGRRIHWVVERADGSERDVEVSLAAVNVGGDDLITGFIRDRTEERRLERERAHAHLLLEEKVRERTRELTRINAELQRSTLLLRQAEEMAQLGSFELDIASGAVEWSDELFRICGKQRSTFVPTVDTFLDVVHPDDRDLVRQTLADAIATCGEFELDERIVRPDGEIRHLTSHGKVFADHRGVATRATCSCQDVTERKAAEEARYRLVDIAEASEDAILGISVDGQIETWNAGATKIFGYTREEVLGRPCTMLVAPGHAPGFEEPLQRTIAGEHVPHYELQHRRKDGSLFDASVTLSAIRDRSGALLGLSKVLRDITQQKHFESRLKASLVEKEVLLREIHHRVKNNLQVISSLLNLQVATESSEQSRRRLLESQNRIQSMALVHQLLYQSTDLGRIDVTDYLRTLAVRLLATYNVGPERIELTVDGPSLQLGIDRVIPCGLIVNELVANAIDHAFPDERRGHIWLSLARDNGTLHVTVRDNGIGIPADVTFESIQTFGLQIAHTLTEQLGGRITIAREHGTAIHIAFPVADVGSAQGDAAPPR